MIRVSKQTEKWGIRVLGVVCVALVASLGWKLLRNSNSKVSAAQSAVAKPGKAGKAKKDDLERFNPRLNLALLKQIESQPLPKTARNPFEYPPPPAPPVQAAAPAPAPKPPPPPKADRHYNFRSMNIVFANRAWSRPMAKRILPPVRM